MAAAAPIVTQPLRAASGAPPRSAPGPLDGVDRVVVCQLVEVVEAATWLLSFGCCKVETENRYEVKDAASGRLLLACEEESSWCLRNPCLCCDCLCWCCHCDCSGRRPLTLHLARPDGPRLLEMERPCDWGCLPCCLQNLTVFDPTPSGVRGRRLGSVRQVIGWSSPPACSKIEVADAQGAVLYTIRTPCLLTTCCCTQVDFAITDPEGRETGQIVKSSSSAAKELLTDGDRFELSFPADCSADGRALLLGAVFLLDYLFYEE